MESDKLENDPAQSMLRTLGAIEILPLESGIQLRFPVTRALGSALLLALFGAASMLIGMGSLLGLLGSTADATSNLLALVFGGVFALPLVLLGAWFTAIACWTATNSVTVDIDPTGIHVIRRCFGMALSRARIPNDEITALEPRIAARYVGAFGTTRYYRLFARQRAGATLIADSIKGADSAEQIRELVARKIGRPELAATVEPRSTNS